VNLHEGVYKVPVAAVSADVREIKTAATKWS